MGGRSVKHRKPYPYLHEITDRHGHRRAYLRKPGFKSVPLPLPVGSRAFVEAYRAALEDGPALIDGRVKARSIAALVELYYQSRQWNALAPQSQRTYKNILTRFVTEHGHRLVAHLEPKHVEALIAAKAKTPTAANKLRKLLSLLMRIAVMEGWRKDNPVAVVKGMEINSEGHRTWTDDEIAQFEERHPFGTKAHLALSLLLYTGQRRSDVVKLGRKHVRDGRLVFTQTKNERRKPVTISMPILPALQDCIDHVTAERIAPTFLLTEYGHKFSEAGFTNKFRDWAKEAGLPDGLTPHGLRKAFCRRAAEWGLTAHQIMAITGHKTLTEVTRYTAAADRSKMADEAMKVIGTRTGFGNPKD